MYLDWKTTDLDYYVIDVEGDLIPSTKVFCVCWYNLKTKEEGELRGYGEIKDFFANPKGVFIAHNGIKYDFPTLNRLVGCRIPMSRCIDTLVLSNLYSPSLDGGHSLAAWGDRLGIKKLEFKDFTEYTPEMGQYCRVDVKICAEIYCRLVVVMRKLEFSEKSCYIQHHFTNVIREQQQNGFYFNNIQAEKLLGTLREELAECSETIREKFPAERVFVAERKKFKKDGTEMQQYLKDKISYSDIEEQDESYRVYYDKEFNIGSPPQRVTKLLDLGWTPEEFTKAGSPKPFDKGDLTPSLQAFVEKNPNPEIKLIAEWMSFNGRANMVNNWLENYNDQTHCIHGDMFVADTLRLRHSNPNSANVPGVRLDDAGSPVLGRGGFYTYEARDCWAARPSRVLVGTDADGLELRMLAHYLNRADFTKQVVEGDPHQYNADLVGVVRPKAKTLLYAIQYGAQKNKVASIMGVSSTEGDAIRTMFLERLGIDQVMRKAMYEQKRGRITLLDGSQIVCPSPHAALNYRLQGGGARVMAQGAIFLRSYIRRDGLDSLKVGDIHDEWQYDVAVRDSKRHAELAIRALQDAGEELNLHLPITGKSKIGKTWAETH